ncbi:tyrosine-type recombinase/integrase [Kitasatospora sp. NPDC006786]|uniref:tyrosine-type recombinase/integrase n=1 Tax=unclassified Kitasatospora TaxID=2633591 RepID=UPI0033DB3918
MFEERTYQRCACKGPLFHRRGKDKGEPVLNDNGTQRIGTLGTGCPDLSKKGHGSWYFYIELPTVANGEKQRIRRGGFRTQRDAASACTKVWEEHKAGLDVGVRETLGQYLDRWIESKGDVSLTTTRRYTDTIRLHIAPFIGHIDRKELRKQHVEDMIAAIRERNTQIQVHRDYVALLADDCEQKRLAWHNGPKGNRRGLRIAWHEARELLASERRRQRKVTELPTQHQILDILSSALNDAVRAELITKNWAQLVKLPRKKPPRPMLWTPARVARWRETGIVPGTVMVWTPQLTGQFLDTYVDHELCDLFHFMALRGPRRGEVCALPWTEVDLDERRVTINQQVITVAYKLFGAEPKADSERTIDLDSESARLFDLRRARQSEARARLAEAWTDTGLVFTREDGTGYHPDYLTKLFKRLVELADLPPITLHGLRHGAACIAHAGGSTPKAISEQLGHSGIQITMDIYTNVFPEYQRAQAEAALAVVPRATRPATPTPEPLPVTSQIPAQPAADSRAGTGKLSALRRAREKKAARTSQQLAPA